MYCAVYLSGAGVAAQSLPSQFLRLMLYLASFILATWNLEVALDGIVSCKCHFSISKLKYLLKLVLDF